MTHLEILAGRLSMVMWEAVALAVRQGVTPVVSLRDYYIGKAVGLAMAADHLRAEAMSRDGIDKEEAE